MSFKPSSLKAVRAVLVWLALLLFAVGNGALRELLLVPVLDAVTARMLSGVILSAGIVVLTVATLPWLKPCSKAELWRIGLAWLAMTLVFEIGLGLLQGLPWDVLLRAYTLQGGNLWPVVLVVIACAPWLAARLRRWS